MMVCTALLLAALTTLLLSALTWRWLVKPALILCVLSAAAGMHFMLAYGVLSWTNPCWPTCCRPIRAKPRIWSIPACC